MMRLLNCSWTCIVSQKFDFFSDEGSKLLRGYLVKRKDPFVNTNPTGEIYKDIWIAFQYI